MYAVCSSSAGDDGALAGWLSAGLLARVQLTTTVDVRTPTNSSLSLLRTDSTEQLYSRGSKSRSAELHSDRIYGCCSHGGNWSHWPS